jgi:hypothetical protein
LLQASISKSQVGYEEATAARQAAEASLALTKQIYQQQVDEITKHRVTVAEKHKELQKLLANGKTKKPTLFDIHLL